MFRRPIVVLLLALAVSAPAARADGGPSPGVLLGGAGVLSANGAVRYVTLGAGAATLVEAVGTRGGRVLRAGALSGGWGIPAVAYDGTAGGLSRNGHTLVLAEQGLGAPLRRVSRFAVVDPKSFRRRTITLRGDFSFDALSPDGRRLYLIQHISATNVARYLVRLYDLPQHRLVAHAIADRAQRGWVMEGSPVSRTASADTRFVYTLYQNPGGYPFVHALDTARSVAHCIGLPWAGDQGPLAMMHLTLRNGVLSIGGRDTTPFFTVDTRTYHAAVWSASTGTSRWWLTALLAPIALCASSRMRTAATRLRRRPVRV